MNSLIRFRSLDWEEKMIARYFAIGVLLTICLPAFIAWFAIRKFALWMNLSLLA